MIFINSDVCVIKYTRVYLPLLHFCSDWNPPSSLHSDRCCSSLAKEHCSLSLRHSQFVFLVSSKVGCSFPLQCHHCQALLHLKFTKQNRYISYYGNFSLIFRLKCNCKSHKSHYYKVICNWLAWVYNEIKKNKCKNIKLRK